MSNYVWRNQAINKFAWKMKIDNILLDKLTAQAQASPRLRMNLDLRNSDADSSQRMLNAIEPGSVMPIHRHRKTSETVSISNQKMSKYGR